MNFHLKESKSRISYYLYNVILVEKFVEISASGTRSHFNLIVKFCLFYKNNDIRRLLCVCVHKRYFNHIH